MSGSGARPDPFSPPQFWIEIGTASGASFGSTQRRPRSSRGAPEPVNYRVKSMSTISLLVRSVHGRSRTIFGVPAGPSRSPFSYPGQTQTMMPKLVATGRLGYSLPLGPQDLIGIAPGARSAPEHVNMGVDSMSPIPLLDRSRDAPGPLLESPRHPLRALFSSSERLKQRCRNWWPPADWVTVYP